MSTSGVVLRQVRLEQRSFWRNPDAAFFTFLLPPALLLLLGTVNSDDTVPGRDIDIAVFFVPGIVAFGVIVGAFANLATQIVVLRSDGVLKRIRTTPLSPTAYLTSQLVSTLTTTLAVSAVTIAIGAVVFGAAPTADGTAALLLGLILGIACFASLGLAISTIIRSAEAAGPVTNAVYLPLALLSGVFDPTMSLPSVVTRAVEAFPIKALTDVLTAGYDPAQNGVPAADLAVLAVWSAIGMLVATRHFRWNR